MHELRISETLHEMLVHILYSDKVVTFTNVTPLTLATNFKKIRYKSVGRIEVQQRGKLLRDLKI